MDPQHCQREHSSTCISVSGPGKLTVYGTRYGAVRWERQPCLKHGIAGGAQELHEARNDARLDDLVNGRVGLSRQQLPGDTQASILG